MKDDSNRSTARAEGSWGADIPDWILALALACDALESSQAKVAKQLGVSAAVVNQALGNAYKGDLDKLETRVRGALMHETVPCPIVGDLEKDRCIEYSTSPVTGTNPLRRLLEEKCPTCKFNRKNVTGGK